MKGNTQTEKDKKIDLNNKIKQICFILLILAIGIVLYRTSSQESKDSTADVIFQEAENASDEINQKIIIHIKGEVLHPGVYEIGGDLRLADAIEAAGGLTENADIDALNLAMFINDGDEIIIPARGTAALTVNSSDNSRATLVSASSSGSSARVNINTASKEQLSALPGIGDSIAAKIIQYRTYIKFSTPSDIMNVPGIGQSKYENIKDRIFVK